MSSQPGIGRIDHLVWSTPDLESGISQVEALTGVRPSAGGSHPGVGTHNALLSLGERRYLEIIASDPDQADYRRPRPFQLDVLDRPQLVTWAANTNDLASRAGLSFADGQALGEMAALSRTRPDGVTLSWQMTDPYVRVDGGVVPFLIDWGQSLHPAADLADEVRLLALQIRHPRAASVRDKLHRLKIDIEVAPSDHAELVAILDTPAGTVELR